MRQEPRVLLINVCLRYDSPVYYIPVGLASIATALRDAGYTPDILDIDLHRLTDAQVQEYLEHNTYDIIGLGNIISGYSHTKRLCSLVKKIQPEALLVVGNTVASVPEQLLVWNPSIDIAVIGEGDRTIVDVVNAWRNNEHMGNVKGIGFRDETGKIVRTEPQPGIKSMMDIPFPDFSLFDIDTYLEHSWKGVPEPLPLPREEMLSLPINTARGCPFSCTFCHHAFKSNGYRVYPFDVVVQEYKRLQQEYGVKYMKFWDELTLLTKERTVELCDVLEREGLEVFWPISPRGNLYKAKDLDLLKRCASLGATTIGGALESASPEILAAMNKKIEPDQFVEQMVTARRAGVQPTTSLVFGYPQETKESIALTLETCERAGVYPSAGYLLPLPNTPIYEQARLRGIIGDEEEYLLRIADRQDLHVNLTAMEDEEMTEAVTQGLLKLKDALGVAISDDEVIKTTYLRATAESARD